MNLSENSRRGFAAEPIIRTLPLDVRNAVLAEFADNLLKHSDSILEANAQDLQAASESGMSAPMLDRLTLTQQRIDAMCEGIRQVIQLPDPLHRVLDDRMLENGLHLRKISVPIGVIGILFESRPNVAADCSSLCFKAGNSVILKGGKESIRSCQEIVKSFQEALATYHLPLDAVQLCDLHSHEEVETWIQNRNALDLLIPRGSKRLIQSVVEHAKVPVIETGAGVCHVYVDQDADLDMADAIIINAKCSHPSVCNAIETLLLHEAIAKEYLPHILDQLALAGVTTVYGNPLACSLDLRLKEADSQTFYTEYNDRILNLAVVSSVDEALAHINLYGTHHSESIVTRNQETAQYFMDHCDSACVYHNASTRFTDGFEFGFGAEIGISTQKLHARGPMALNEITTYTYHIEGHGEIR